MADGDDGGMNSGSVGSGSVVGGYRLEVRVGAGQMGVVWRAARIDDGALVAVKLLRDDLVEDHDLVRRFTRERDALLRVSGSHVASLRDLILEGNTIALVTEYLAGGDLRRWLDRHGRRPALDAAALAIQVFDGLASIHRAGIVHRDVKPANVLLKDDQSQPALVLADFGLAHLAGATITRHSHAVMGTPMYLAPEVIKGDPATPVADLYAGGIVLYELLAGAPPFVGDHPWAVMHAHIEQEPPRLPDCPDELWQLLAALLAKDPEGRPGTAAAVRDQLREATRAPEDTDKSGPSQGRSREILDALAEGAAEGAAEAVAEHVAETVIDDIQGATQPTLGPDGSTGGPGSPGIEAAESSTPLPGPEAAGSAEPSISAEPAVSTEAPSDRGQNPDSAGDPPSQPDATPDPTSVQGETAGDASSASGPAEHATSGTGPSPDPTPAQGGTTAGTSAGAGTASGSASAGTGIVTFLAWAAAIVGVVVGVPALINAATSAEEVPSTTTTTRPPVTATTRPPVTTTTRPPTTTTTSPPTTTTTPPPTPATADVGQCVEIDAAFTEVAAVGECQPGSSATYRVAAVVNTPGSCPNSEQAYISSGDFVLCLDLNIYENYCYERRSDSSGAHITAVDCGGSTAWHVVAVVPGAIGAQAEAVCPYTTTNSWEFYAPQMVVCVNAS